MRDTRAAGSAGPGCALQAAGCGLRDTRCRLRIVGCWLRTAGSTQLLAAGCALQAARTILHRAALNEESDVVVPVSDNRLLVSRLILRKGALPFKTLLVDHVDALDATCGAPVENAAHQTGEDLELGARQLRERGRAESVIDSETSVCPGRLAVLPDRKRVAPLLVDTEMEVLAVRDVAGHTAQAVLGRVLGHVEAFDK